MLVASILAYCACSAGMALTNKVAVDAFPLVGTLVALQLAGAVVLLVPCWQHVVVVGWRDTLRWLPVPLTFVAMLGTSLQAYAWNTVSAVVIVRNVAPFLAVLVERATQRDPPPFDRWMATAMAVILLGVTIYGAADLDVTARGLGMILLNLAFAVANRCTERWLMASYKIGLSTTGMMLYNNAFGALLVVPLVLALGEPPRWPAAFDALTTLGWWAVGGSVVVAFGLSFTGLHLQRRIDATSFMVLTNLNKIAVLAVEWAFLGKTYTTASLVGSAIAMGGGALYGAARKRASDANAEPMVDVLRRWAGVALALLFIGLNLTLNLYNKWLFKGLPLPITLVVVQQLGAGLVLAAWFGVRERALPRVRGRVLRGAVAMSLLFGTNTVLNNASLVSLSLTLNQCVRAFLPCVVLVVSVCLEGKRYPWTRWGTGALIAAGIVMGVWKNPSFELGGFVLVASSTLLAGCFDSMSGWLLGGEERLAPTVLTLYQSAVVAVACLPFLVAWEAPALQTAWATDRRTVALGMGGGAALALAYNLVRFNLVQQTNSLFLPMLGNFKVGMLVVLDVWLFDETLSTLNVVGVVVTVGAFVVHAALERRAKGGKRPPVGEDVEEGVELLPGCSSSQPQSPCQGTN